MNNKTRNILLIGIVIFFGSYVVRSFVIASMRIAFYRQQALRKAQRPKPKEPNSDPKLIKPLPWQTGPLPVVPPPPIHRPGTQVAENATPPVADASAAPAVPALEAPSKELPAAPTIEEPPPAPLPVPRRARAGITPKPSSATRIFEGIWTGQTAIDGRGLCTLRLEIHQRPAAPERFSGFSQLTCNPLPSLVPTGQANRNAGFIDSHDPESAVLEGAAKDDAIQFTPTKIIGTDADGCAPSSLTSPASAQPRSPLNGKIPAAAAAMSSCGGPDETLARARLSFPRS